MLYLSLSIVWTSTVQLWNQLKQLFLILCVDWLMEYIFTYSNPISVCDRFSFTVTPTEGEMRGTTSEPVTGFFTRAEGVYGAL